MKSIKVCEYSRSRSFHDDLILQDQASGERSQDQWSSGLALDLAGCDIGVQLSVHSLVDLYLSVKNCCQTCKILLRQRVFLCTFNSCEVQTLHGYCS